MKLIIERSTLLRALGHVQRVVERRNTIPILANVLLRAEKDSLLLTATDLDLEISETVVAQVERMGATTAPALMLYEIARKLPEGGQVMIDVMPESSVVNLRSGRSNFVLPCLPFDEFPVMSDSDFSHSFSISSADLRSMIDRTRFAISAEETRYYLNGIHMHAVQSPDADGAVSVLRTVATDGHRLARTEVLLPDGAAGMPAVIIPRKMVGETHHLVDEAAGEISLYFSQSKMRIILDQVTLTSKLVDGTFPEYQRVIPTANDRILEVDCKLFAAAVDRVTTISTEKSRAVKLALKSGNLVLSAHGTDGASAQEELEVSYESPPMEIGFNARYLLDITQQIKGDAARIALADAASPTLVRDVADESTLFVLMPMRV